MNEFIYKVSSIYDMLSNIIMATMFAFGIFIFSSSALTVAFGFSGILSIVSYFNNVSEFLAIYVHNEEDERLDKRKLISHILNYVSIGIFIGFIASILIGYVK